MRISLYSDSEAGSHDAYASARTIDASMKKACYHPSVHTVFTLIMGCADDLLIAQHVFIAFYPICNTGRCDEEDFFISAIIVKFQFNQP